MMSRRKQLALFSTALLIAITACTWIPTSSESPAPVGEATEADIQLPTQPGEGMPPTEPSPTPESERDHSQYWMEVEDYRTGIRFAIPCFWYANIPNPEQDPGGLGSFPIQNYTEEFAMSFPRSIAGLWESGAIKVDMGYMDSASWGFTPGTSMTDFVTDLYSQDPETTLISTEGVEVNGQEALLVTTESIFGTGQFYLLTVSDELFLLFGTRIEVMQNPDVQGILNSIAIKPEASTQIPKQMPGEPPTGIEAPCLGEALQDGG